MKLIAPFIMGVSVNMNISKTSEKINKNSYIKILPKVLLSARDEKLSPSFKEAQVPKKTSENIKNSIIHMDILIGAKNRASQTKHSIAIECTEIVEKLLNNALIIIV